MAIGPKEWSPRGEYPQDDVRRWFDLPRVWQEIRHARQHPDFEPGLAWQVEELVPGSAGTYQAIEVAELFEISREDLEDSEDPWDVVLAVLDGLSRAMNERKPADISGKVYFGWHEADNSFGLMYEEEEAE